MASSSASLSFTSRRIMNTSWVHCPSASWRANLPKSHGSSFIQPWEAARPHFAIFRCAGRQRLLGAQSLKTAWQRDESGLATSFWGLWNLSIMELLGASTVTSFAPWLRIPSWSFSCCLYTKLLNYESVKCIFLLSVEKQAFAPGAYLTFWDPKLSHF